MYFGVHWNGNCPQSIHFEINFSQSFKPPLVYIRKGLNLSWLPIQKYQRETQLDFYKLTISGDVAFKILEAIIPYLIAKKKQARYALQFHKQHKKGEWTLDDWKLILKQKENVHTSNQKRKKGINRLKNYIKIMKKDSNYQWNQTHFGFYNRVR